MKTNAFIITVILHVLIVSCTKWGSRENSRLIGLAQELIEVNPDSALKLLDGVNTVRFSKAERAEYILLRVQAKENAGMDLSTDTEIFAAQKYFISKDDPEKAALACFYAGVVLQAQEAEAEAIEYYLKANDFAQNTNN